MLSTATSCPDPRLVIGGIEPFSTVDWPDKIVAVAFLAGCPWRCRYCHNPHLWQRSGSTDGKGNPLAYQSFADLRTLLEKRKGLLDGVVFSGGEPCAQPDLIPALQQVTEMGFLAGLHTGGAYPELFQEALPYLSWVGFDVKAPFAQYEQVTGVPDSGTKAQESFELLLASGLPFEARTTFHPDVLSEQDLISLAQMLASHGVTRWVVQAYRALGTTGELRDVPVYPFEVPKEASTLFSEYVFR